MEKKILERTSESYVQNWIKVGKKKAYQYCFPSKTDWLHLLPQWESLPHIAKALQRRYDMGEYWKFSEILKFTCSVSTQAPANTRLWAWLVQVHSCYCTYECAALIIGHRPWNQEFLSVHWAQITHGCFPDYMINFSQII
jgi:hypothetical protein